MGEHDSYLDLGSQSKRYNFGSGSSGLWNWQLYYIAAQILKILDFSDSAPASCDVEFGLLEIFDT
jgi:hypothetical protein